VRAQKKIMNVKGQIKEQQISGRVNFNTESKEEAQRAQRISDTKGLSEA